MILIGCSNFFTVSVLIVISGFHHFIAVSASSKPVLDLNLSLLQITIEMNGETVEYKPASVPTAEYLTQAYPASDSNGNGENKQCRDIELPTGDSSYRLEELAYTRSGDKGNDCNIGRRSLGF